jgi:predicted Rossmann-fold nucleotide-binding protein
MGIQSLAIFCGSKTGVNKRYMQHATELGKILAENFITIIYGGGKKGLMGCIADTALQYGGIVKGVIPQVLVKENYMIYAMPPLFCREGSAPLMKCLRS